MLLIKEKEPQIQEIYLVLEILQYLIDFIAYFIFMFV